MNDKQALTNLVNMSSSVDPARLSVALQKVADIGSIDSTLSEHDDDFTPDTASPTSPADILHEPVDSQLSASLAKLLSADQQMAAMKRAAAEAKQLNNANAADNSASSTLAPPTNNNDNNSDVSTTTTAAAATTTTPAKHRDSRHVKQAGGSAFRRLRKLAGGRTTSRALFGNNNEHNYFCELTVFVSSRLCRSIFGRIDGTRTTNQSIGKNAGVSCNMRLSSHNSSIVKVCSIRFRARALIRFRFLEWKDCFVVRRQTRRW
jgi:hypothetical protein